MLLLKNITEEKVFASALNNTNKEFNKPEFTNRIKQAAFIILEDGKECGFVVVSSLENINKITVKADIDRFKGRKEELITLAKKAKEIAKEIL